MGERRLFIAVWPSEDVIEELRLLHRKDQLGVRFVPEDNWHFTLQFLGVAQPEQICAALDAIRVRADRGGGRPGRRFTRRPFGSHRCPRPRTLARSGGSGDRRFGSAPVRQRFVGHVTLARLGRRAVAGRQRLGLLGTPFSARFLGKRGRFGRESVYPDGARYETLTTWPAAPHTRSPER